MSEENVETIRAVWGAINRGDLDAAIAHLPADFILDWSASIGPESGVFRGHDEIRRVFASTTESWSEVESSRTRSSMPGTRWCERAAFGHEARTAGLT